MVYKEYRFDASRKNVHLEIWGMFSFVNAEEEAREAV